ncbi:MAG: hypothetical protein ABI360_08220, partial [Allobranchiibius sp.]
AVMLIVPVVVDVPVILGAAFARNSPPAQLVMLVIGLLWGAAALGLSIWWSGRYLDRTSSNMLLKLRAFG